MTLVVDLVQRSVDRVSRAMLLCIVVIYLAMAATFRNLRRPLRIMVPTFAAATAAAAILVYTGNPLSLFHLISLMLVVGLGRSGRGAAALARRHGARVVGVDLRTGLEPIDGVMLELGPHRRERFLWPDLIVVSPGVPPSAPDLVAARRAGIPMVGELAFAWSFLRDLPSIAITGTNGKSTVTHFTGQLLQASGRDVFVGGNLGTPLSDAAMAEVRPEGLVVEVSSYQLELWGTIAPDVAGVHMFS